MDRTRAITNVLLLNYAHRRCPHVLDPAYEQSPYGDTGGTRYGVVGCCTASALPGPCRRFMRGHLPHGDRLKICGTVQILGGAVGLTCLSTTMWNALVLGASGAAKRHRVTPRVRTRCSLLNVRPVLIQGVLFPFVGYPSFGGAVSEARQRCSYSHRQRRGDVEIVELGLRFIKLAEHAFDRARRK